MNALLAAISLLVFRSSASQDVAPVAKIPAPVHPEAINGVYAPARPLQPVIWE